MILRVGLFNEDKSKYAQLDKVDNVCVGNSGELTIEHHTNQVTCYASGMWRWYYSYPEEDVK